MTISASRPSVSLWQSFTRQLVDLENKILRQTIATGTQTTTVKRMRSDFATGKASKSALEREESVLNAMEAELESLAEQFEDTARRAFNVFGVVRNVGDVVSAWTGALRILDCTVMLALRLTWICVTTNHVDGYLF